MRGDDEKGVRVSKLGRVALASAVSAGAVAGPMAGAAVADVNYPANCKTWATGTSWSSNCWLGYNYEANGNMTIGVQGHLLGEGYFGGTVDGKWNSLTDGAVRNFQAANGYTADGIVGNLTWGRLKNTTTYKYQTSAYLVYEASAANAACRDCFFQDKRPNTPYYQHWYVYDIDPSAEYLLPFTVFGPG